MEPVTKYFPHAERNKFLTPLQVQPVPNSINWIVMTQFEYVDYDGNLIIVPQGFVTDFASVPPLARFGAIFTLVFQFISRFVWWFWFFEVFAIWVCFVAEWLENSGTDEIAVIHDHCYATRCRSRWQADWILFTGMRAANATRNPLWKCWLFWINVRLAGWKPWADDAAKAKALITSK